MSNGGEPAVQRVGRYEISRKLGEGGMGVVYAARDPRLERSVALKMIRNPGDDPQSRERLWREARAAASVTHPNICQLYEIDEEDGQLFITMELLEGESLGDRIARGALSLDETASITRTILSALESLHGRGLVHRDLKPTNVFITPLGVKLLDFGLARSIAGIDERTVDAALTQAGTLMGTPRYMAPEQWRGEELTPGADLFSVGAMMYEMLTGEPAFGGDSLVAVYDSVRTHEPRLLGGSPAASAMDRIIHRALRKRPQERFRSASDMADALRAAQSISSSGEVSAPRTVTRLMVLPLRVLRPDPDTDFLAFALSDAVTSSLSGLNSLVVRSSVTAARFASDAPDLAQIAAQADVDAVISGTLLRAGDQVRVSTQLMEAPSGTVLWSQTHQAPAGDVFQLQDALTRRIVESVSGPLGGREREVLDRNAPASARSYELYLRANQLSYQSGKWALARDLYLECLELDPRYAPAWARLGRVYRIIAVYTGQEIEENYRRAREAFARALEISPKLSLAHNLYTNLEVELGSARDAMIRLLGRVRENSLDADLYAGLVQACRYCDLLDPAIEAYERGRRIDPGLRTSVMHAYMMKGDYARALETDVEDPPIMRPLVLDLMGQVDDGISEADRMSSSPVPLIRQIACATGAMLRQAKDAVSETDQLLRNWSLRDPCAAYYAARFVARLGDRERAIPLLRQTLDDGFCGYTFMMHDPWLDPVRGDPQFQDLLRRELEVRRQAQMAYLEAGGDRLLGVSAV